MPGIPDGTIDEVRAASDLVDVVSDRVRLKKQGQRFVGLCPFHNEKSPSFSVDAAQGLYYCFGCRRGGDVFKFIEEVEGVGFLDSVRLLADRAGIEIREEGAGPEADRKSTLLAALRFAAQFYFDQLKTETGARGLAYLKERGFTKEAVKAFGIGVAPDGWDGFARAAAEAGYKPDVLEAVGLVKERQGGGGHYDVFRDRLMFPILSPIGKVLGFGGRILPDTQTGSADYTPAKYVNSPETEVYQKSRVLYGMKQAKRSIRTEREAIVVEGYADVVSLWQAGVQNVVAASGTALTAQQIDLLARLDVQRLILLFDADAAGQSAARKGVDVALDGGLAPYAVTLPDGADPDSFVRQFGAEAFRRYLADERLDFVAFLVQAARREGALDTPEGKARVVREVLATIRRLGDPIQTGEYLRRAAEALDVYETDLRRQFEGSPPPRRPRREAPPPEAYEDVPPRPEVVPIRPEEALLLRLMLTHKAPMVEHVLTRMGVDEFTEGAARDVIAALIEQFQGDGVSVEPFVRGQHGEAARALTTEVLAERHSLSGNWETKVGVSVPDRDERPFDSATSAMRLLKLDRVQEAIEAATRRMQSRERAGEPITDLQAEVVELNDLRRRIERGEFMEWSG
ncbi:MAG: DNA primase [Bacteroidota bacterium]